MRKLIPLIIIVSITCLMAIPAHAASGSRSVVVSTDTLSTVTVEATDTLDTMTAVQIMASPAGELISDRIEEIIEDRLADHDYSKPILGGLIKTSVIGVIAVFGFPFIFSVLALILSLNYINRRGERRAKLIEMSIKCGQPLPPEFFTRRKRDNFQSGLTWLAWGAGLMIFFIVTGTSGTAALMSVPCFIGISKFVTVLIDSRNRGRNQ